MKKRILSLLLALLLAALLCPAALAAETNSGEATSAVEETQPPVLPFVLDNAGLLSERERAALTQKAEVLSAEHQCNLYIITVQDYTALDYNIRTGLSCTDFLNPDCVTIPAGDAPILLEVKWDAYLPSVIRGAVQTGNLRAGAFSKYAQCRIYG